MKYTELNIKILEYICFKNYFCKISSKGFDMIKYDLFFIIYLCNIIMQVENLVECKIF